MGCGGDEVGVLASKKLAFIFPGQGSQSVGMGKNLAENYSAAANVFRRGDEVLGFSISELCFDGPDEDLKQTINTQPALFLTSIAAFEVVREQGITPAFTAGHSVGEYAALYAAGAFDLETGLWLVKQRAELMQRAASENPGTMAAILGLSPEQVQEVVSKASDVGVVVAANLNSPIQTVISGELDAVARASQIASEMGAKRVVPLNVSGAFHSPLMQSAADALEKTLCKVEIRDLDIPVVANVTADFEIAAREVRENLAKQITGSVRWVESVQRMASAGADVFVELGPGNVLAGLVKRIAPDVEVYSVGDKSSLDALMSNLH